MNKGACQLRGAPVVRAVLDATLDELARVGYGQLNIEQIAARAGVNKTTVYRRWPAKADLVGAALTSFADALPPVEASGDVRTDLLGIARRTTAIMSSPRGRGLIRMVLGGCLEPDLVGLAFSLRKEAEAPLRRVIAQAVVRGELRPDVEPDLLLDALSGWIIHTLFRDRVPVTEDNLSRLVNLLLTGAAGARAAPPQRLPAPARHRRKAARRG
jgi:AcrR family transcriptional regulator